MTGEYSYRTGGGQDSEITDHQFGEIVAANNSGSSKKVLNDKVAKKRKPLLIQLIDSGSQANFETPSPINEDKNRNDAQKKLIEA